MDDIKLYAKNKRNIISLINLTMIFSSNISMSFRRDKDTNGIKIGKMIITEGVQNSYKYLVIQQAEYYHRVLAINTYASNQIPCW